VWRKFLALGKIKVITVLVLLAAVVFYTLCYLASIRAAEIFNREIARQHVLQGTLTVGRLSANPLGKVSFHDLVWLSPEGEKLAQIPEGYIHVSPWDVVTRNYSTTMIKSVELDNAIINLNFNKDMSVKDVDRSKRDVKAVRKNGKRQPVSKEQWATSKIIGQKDFDFRLLLNNCVLTTIYEKRNFTMKDVDADIHLNTRDKLEINFSSGPFGGTIVAQGLVIKGTVDLKQQQPVCNLSLNITECNPASLGSGIDVHETVSTDASITGTLPDVVIDGALRMEALTIPALDFTNVVGFFHYADGLIKASKITANVYGGNVDASGEFNLDTKGYSLDILGHALKAMIAAHDPKIRCDVELDVKIRSDGNPKTTLTYGSFTSGAGSYMLVPFESIRGEFKNIDKVLTFKNVVITTKFGQVKSDAFQIIRGKLHLDNLYLEDQSTGERKQLR